MPGPLSTVPSASLSVISSCSMRGSRPPRMERGVDGACYQLFEEGEVDHESGPEWEVDHESGPEPEVDHESNESNEWNPTFDADAIFEACSDAEVNRLFEEDIHDSSSFFVRFVRFELFVVASFLSQPFISFENCTS